MFPGVKRYCILLRTGRQREDSGITVAKRGKISVMTKIVLLSPYNM